MSGDKTGLNVREFAYDSKRGPRYDLTPIDKGAVRFVCAGGYIEGTYKGNIMHLHASGPDSPRLCVLPDGANTVMVRLVPAEV